MDTQLLIGLLTSAVIGSGLTHFVFNRRLEGIKSQLSTASLRSSAAHQYREAKYAQLLTQLRVAYISEDASSATKNVFDETYSQAWLYSSQEVIRSIEDFIDIFVGRVSVPQEEAELIIYSIIKAMRQDLGQAELEYYPKYRQYV